MRLIFERAAYLHLPALYEQCEELSNVWCEIWPAEQCLYYPLYLRSDLAVCCAPGLLHGTCAWYQGAERHAQFVSNLHQNTNRNTAAAALVVGKRCTINADRGSKLLLFYAGLHP